MDSLGRSCCRLRIGRGECHHVARKTCNNSARNRSGGKQEAPTLEQMLGLLWEHPPTLDTEVVVNIMQLTRDRIRGLEDRIRALLAEQKELIVRAVAFAVSIPNLT
ncbi:hypothetical protein L1987_19367 [Smallanthus sonchifolius]|uniref:Uncharacterized protein n=1 Tax=Smallanthus sonchifolius TaxID=185202 RepID=A0ACB9INV9_9ASTR|nr:hypothetical protein L1987_19367 [Smallanthus sonchifolius]